MKVEFYATDKCRMVWNGKLSAIPRLGDSVLINNKSHFGRYTVTKVDWEVDKDTVSCDVKEAE